MLARCIQQHPENRDIPHALRDAAHHAHGHGRAGGPLMTKNETPVRHDTGQATRSGHCREDLVRCGDLWAVACQPLRRKETEVCGAGTVASSGAHLRILER
jgi:hypothetical protein